MTGTRIAIATLLSVTLSALTMAYAQDSAESITLNLKDADIVEVISMVSDVTGKNFVVDPRVRATVTVISARPLSPDGLYETLLSILQVHGFAAVETGDIIKVMPDVAVRHSGDARLSGPYARAADEVVTRVIQVQNVPAAQLVALLRPLISQHGVISGFAPSNMLILSDRAGNVDRVSAIIDRIDQAGDEEIEVVQLQYASAGEVVRVLGALIQGQNRGEGSSAPTLAADERTNSVLIGGDRAQRLRLRALVAHLDTPLDAAEATQVIYLKYADAENISGILQGYSTRRTGSSGQAGGQSGGQQPAQVPGRVNENVSIVADTTTNALVITAPPAEMRRLRSIIDQLDIRRAQVLVEAIIVEVTSDRSAEFGIQWAVDPGDSDNPAGVINFSRGGAGIIQLGVDPTSITPPEGLTLGVGRIRSGATSFVGLLRALAGDASNNILSTPQLMTMDNEEAEINVGQQVPFLTGQFTGAGQQPGGVNPFQTINREDVGLKLKITPKINEGNAVQLAIEQEVSSLSQAPTGAVDLVTNRREIKTRVIVEDGDIIVLGGLIDDTLQENQERVPILGSIPILGRAFRYETTSKVKRNLMVFLRPQIIRDAAAATLHTNRRYRDMQELQEMLQDKRVPLMPDVDRPILPPVDEPEPDPEP